MFLVFYVIVTRLFTDMLMSHSSGFIQRFNKIVTFLLKLSMEFIFQVKINSEILFHLNTIPKLYITQNAINMKYPTVK